MLATCEDYFLKPLSDGLKPDPLYTIDQWSEVHRILSAKGSAEPGRWRNSRTPYLVEIMRELSPTSKVQKVVFMKASQIGATELGNNWIGYVIDVAPGPMLAVQPSISMAKRLARQRLNPLIEESPRLREKILVGKYKDPANSNLSKEFVGGILILTGSNSAGELRSMPCKYVFADEIDGYPGDVEGEGDPVELAIARTRTFRRKKIFMPSTPTEELTSRIAKEFESSDQRFYKVPCPHCGTRQRLVFKQLKWEKGNPLGAWYECEICKEKIQEHHKTKMLASGEWIALNPGAQGGLVAGFHINALYSPVGWMSWGEIALLFVNSHKDPKKLKAFTNTILGETWKEKVEVPDWKRLYKQRESYKPSTVPRGGLFLTQGVDIQGDRIEVQVRAWGRDYENWLVDYQVFYGDTAKTEVWVEMDRMIYRQYPHECGQMLPVLMTAIDANFNTQHVYKFCRKYPRTKVIPVRGSDSANLPISMGQKADVNVKSNKKVKRGVSVFTVGVSILKAEIYSWLRQEPPMAEGEIYPPGFCHQYEIGEEFFKQLTAERLVEKTNANGFTRYEWECLGRNEALDTFVYARAAAAAKGLDRMQSKDFERFEVALGLDSSHVSTPETSTDVTTSVQVSPNSLKSQKTKRKPIVRY